MKLPRKVRKLQIGDLAVLKNGEDADYQVKIIHLDQWKVRFVKRRTPGRGRWGLEETEMPRRKFKTLLTADENP